MGTPTATRGSEKRLRRLTHMFVLVGTLLALFSTPSEKLVTFSDIKHDPFGVWIGELVRYCTRFQSELAQVLCNINIF